MKGKKKDWAEEKNKLQWGPKKSFANPAESLEVIISHQSSSALDWNHQDLCTLHFSVTGYRLLQWPWERQLLASEANPEEGDVWKLSGDHTFYSWIIPFLNRNLDDLWLYHMFLNLSTTFLFFFNFYTHLSYFIFYFFKCIEVELIYSVLISAVQQSDSVVCVRIHSFP